MNEEDIPAWATGSDCFESDAQRRDVEMDRAWKGGKLMNAYCLGDLHALANAIEKFQQAHRLVYREELRALHSQLSDIILFIDREAYMKDFPLQKKRSHPGYSA